jgi:hypothetical protein
MIVLKYVVYGLAQLLGFIILPWFCLAQAWRITTSTINPYDRPARSIDEWSWKPLNKWYGNYEDGVSGEFALIWPAEGYVGLKYPDGRVVYMPGRNPIWRAMCWSVGRNRANAVERYLGL